MNHMKTSGLLFLLAASVALAAPAADRPNIILMMADDMGFSDIAPYGGDMRWPSQVKANTKTDQLGHIIDVLPTCLEVAGAKALAEINGEKTKPLEGRSLAPILRGETRTPPEELCWEWSGNCAVRHGKWKLVWDTAARPVKWELYDLEADRTELHDLAGAKAELVKELSDAYEKWAKATGRKLPGAKGKKGNDE